MLKYIQVRQVRCGWCGRREDLITSRELVRSGPDEKGIVSVNPIQLQ